MRDELWSQITLLAGTADLDCSPWPPFDRRAVAFLAGLSEALRTMPETRQSEEISAFAFWCRPAHLEALQARHAIQLPRLGRGLVFHLAPSNVPTQFAYSLAIGLLAGNANLVRLSGRRGETESLLCQAIGQVLARPVFAPVYRRTALVSYGHDDAITAGLSAACNARIVWGGDRTVTALRAIPLPPRAVELSFPDRFSLALFSQAALSALDEEGLAQLAHRFYNDTYALDQNACSSPRLVLWLEDGGTGESHRRWWQALAAEAAGRYPIDAYRAAEKYALLCRNAMALEPACDPQIEQYGGNLVYVLTLARLPDSLDTLEGRFGLFFQAKLRGLDALPPLLTPRVQTLVCAGLEPRQVAERLVAQGALGGDRVVCPGQALEMDTVWDGHDLISALSRIIG